MTQAWGAKCLLLVLLAGLCLSTVVFQKESLHRIGCSAQAWSVTELRAGCRRDQRAGTYVAGLAGRAQKGRSSGVGKDQA